MGSGVLIGQHTRWLMAREDISIARVQAQVEASCYITLLLDPKSEKATGEGVRKSRIADLLLSVAWYLRSPEIDEVLKIFKFR